MVGRSDGSVLQNDLVLPGERMERTEAWMGGSREMRGRRQKKGTTEKQNEEQFDEEREEDGGGMKRRIYSPKGNDKSIPPLPD